MSQNTAFVSSNGGEVVTNPKDQTQHVSKHVNSMSQETDDELRDRMAEEWTRRRSDAEFGSRWSYPDVVDAVKAGWDAARANPDPRER